MARPFDFGSVHLGVSVREDAAALPARDAPFRIALLGDFSGRASRNLCETGAGLANRPAVLIDRDNFDEVLARSGVALTLPLGGQRSPTTLQFAELDDFHPDRILERTAMFRRLRETRVRLSDPATFAAAAEELGIAAHAQAPPESRGADEPHSQTASGPAEPGSGSLLDQMIEQTAARASEARPSRAPDGLQEFVRRVTEPHLAAPTDSRQAEVLALIDRAIGAQMRALLHVPNFQMLEAAWRAVFFLARRIETNSQLKLYLIDVSKEELASDLNSSRDLNSTGTFQLLVDRTVGTPNAERWAVIAGDYTFGPERQDAELLGRLAKIASAAGAPFIAAASHRLIGCADFGTATDPRSWRLPADANTDGAAAWVALRALREASAVGLAMPRFLLRLPYGKRTDPVESFDFEEMVQPISHEDYLWGNPAFACALLLAQSFSQDGWEMRPGQPAEVDGLPLHAYEQDGEAELKPCAEALLTEDAIEFILGAGPMPLVSFNGRDAIRLARFQSIADPPRALVGPWSR